MTRYIKLENYNQRLMAKVLFQHHFNIREGAMSGAFLQIAENKYKYFELTNTSMGNLGIYAHIDISNKPEDHEVYVFGSIEHFIKQVKEDQKSLKFDDLEVGEFFVIESDDVLRKKISHYKYSNIDMNSSSGPHKWNGIKLKIKRAKNIKISFDIEE